MMTALTAGAAVRVLLADDHAMLRSALRRCLRTHGFIVVAEAANGEEAVSRIIDLEPDIALLDLSMRPMDGLEATRVIAEKSPRVAIVVLTARDDAGIERLVREAGATGFVNKTASIEELVRALRIAAESRGRTTKRVPVRHGVFALSPREIEVLWLVADGYRSLQIGALLGISPRTVDVHRASVLRKLGVASIAEAARIAERSGIVRRAE
jgi:DNA-binding NarL/FixJ family response regulator